MLALFHTSDILRDSLGVWRTACLARNVFDNVPPQDVLNLLLLEATLDDQASAAVDGTARTQLSKQVSGNVLLSTMIE